MSLARLSQALTVVAVLLMSGGAQAHARLASPKPRNNMDNLKTGPCGGVLPTGAATSFVPGQTITVSWEETIAHPGHYRIAFSPGKDQGFDQNVLADKLPNPAGTQGGQAQVTLPDVACDPCTLQLIQVMTDSNPPSNYYSCADIVLTAPPVDAGVDTDAGVSSDAGVTTDGGSGGGPGTDAGELPTTDAGTGEAPDAGGVTMRDAGLPPPGPSPDEQGPPLPEGGVTGQTHFGCSQGDGAPMLLAFLLLTGLAAPAARRERSQLR